MAKAMRLRYANTERSAALQSLLSPSTLSQLELDTCTVFANVKGVSRIF